ncbi:MAG: hypothetical protein ACE5EY_15920, partial [Anaerolineae bacterium]
ERQARQSARETKTASAQSGRYQAYLLRLWRQQAQGQAAAWRISLENVHTGERVIWRSLDELTTFLETQLKTAEKCLDENL